MARFHLPLISFAMASACAAGPSAPPESPMIQPVSEPGSDPHSFARPERVRVRHVALNWNVSFATRRLAGTATVTVERIDEAAPLVLDTRGLSIETVEVAMSGGSFGKATWVLGPQDDDLGRSLSVGLPRGGDQVRIRYVAEDPSGLQWLDPEQTLGKTAPFLYSQSQAIHARSFWPCQDTPGVRTTYDAAIEVDRELRVVMAAKSLTAPGERPVDGVYRFEMPQAVPSYLVAFAVGDLVFRSLGPRSGVWAEPATLDAAADEFADTERMIEAAEKLYGPYRWDRYDLLVLPPAFPFGGMENPRLTFATPTILAGDRSLVSLVAHELAHSWSGNLVTNSTWADLWLNEGFTTYFERRLMEAIYGRERAEMEAVLGLQDLHDDFRDGAKNPADQKLQVDLRGRNPDDGMNAVPYEKGALLLRTIEETWGREAFDAFLRSWFEGHMFQSATTGQFEAFFAANLAQQTPLEGKAPVDLEEWIHRPGLPEGAAAPRVDAFDRVSALATNFTGGNVAAEELSTKDWTPHEWIFFLRSIEAGTNPEQMAALDAAYRLTESGNSEILAVWLELSIVHDYRATADRLEVFLMSVGRRKFLTPLYKALVAGDDEARTWAKKIYARARAGYHAISRDTIDDILGWEG